MMLKAVINQQPVKFLRKPINWELFLKISDFHNLTSIVYFGLLGHQKEISAECGKQLYQKYKKELLLTDSYQKAEEVLAWQLEKHKIHGLILSGSGVKKLYPSYEMSHIEQIQVLVEKEKLPFFCALMESMDYEKTENRIGSGIIYTRTPNIKVILYEELPIENKVLKRFLTASLKSYVSRENYRFVHRFSEEEEYIYRAGMLVELYVRGILKIREIVDFWSFQKQIRSEFQWKIVREQIEKAKIKEFVKQIDVLAKLWFTEEKQEDYETALELEEYIISNGKENKELDNKILPSERVRLDFYRRDREAEWRYRKKKWLFPPKEDMLTTYPILERFSFLIVFFWACRLMKILRKLCANYIKRALARLRAGFFKIKNEFCLFTKLVQKVKNEKG